jgi:hypothetical protein
MELLRPILYYCRLNYAKLEAISNTPPPTNSRGLDTSDIEFGSEREKPGSGERLG